MMIPLKWGGEIDGISVFGFNHIEVLSKTNQVNVVMSSIYAKQILKKLELLNNVNIYEMFDLYANKYDASIEILSKNNEIDFIEYKFRCDNYACFLADEESKNVLNAHYKFFLDKNLNIFYNVCSDYEQYFIPEVLEKINKPLNIIDAGAYEGELNRVLEILNIPVNRWYCFEANPQNLYYMEKKKDKIQYGSRQICIGKGLWEFNGNVFFDCNESETASKIVDYTTKYSIETVTIDSYFADERVDYIKMDIEGAELFALRGGINVIQRDCPILAISIYHSLKDFYEIPEYLIGKLSNYKWYIRHHSLIFSETVLYGIPY